jgi:hypothetical protein
MPHPRGIGVANADMYCGWPNLLAYQMAGWLAAYCCYVRFDRPEAGDQSALLQTDCYRCGAFAAEQMRAKAPAAHLFPRLNCRRTRPRSAQHGVGADGRATRHAGCAAVHVAHQLGALPSYCLAGIHVLWACASRLNALGIGLEGHTPVPVDKPCTLTPNELAQCSAKGRGPDGNGCTLDRAGGSPGMCEPSSPGQPKLKSKLKLYVAVPGAVPQLYSPPCAASVHGH